MDRGDLYYFACRLFLILVEVASGYLTTATLLNLAGCPIWPFE